MFHVNLQLSQKKPGLTNEPGQEFGEEVGGNLEISDRDQRSGEQGDPPLSGAPRRCLIAKR
ncbi:MAG: hypothetical protein AAFR75_11960, partial [Pseudomonadota bacterium]